MDKKANTGQRPPAVPRRTQSARILSGYTSSGKALRVTDEAYEASSSRQPTRRWSERNKTRRSLDAMEKQADELYGFLTDLESKKASCSESDVLSFLTESNTSGPSSDDNSQTSDRSGRTPPGSTKRVSVKDRAKFFLKPDIEEEATEETPKSNSVDIRSQSQSNFLSYSESRNNNNNNNNNNQLNSDLSDTAPMNSISINGLKDETELQIKPLETIETNRGAVASYHIDEKKPIKHDKPEKLKRMNLTTAADNQSSMKDVILAADQPPLNKSEDSFLDFHVETDASELSSDDSDSFSEAELSLENSSRSPSSFSFDRDIDATNRPNNLAPLNAKSESSSDLSSPDLSCDVSIGSESADLMKFESTKKPVFHLPCLNGSEITEMNHHWVGLFKKSVVCFTQVILCD